MLKVGLTGGIGSGKSTVSKIFQNLQVPVYSADREARKLMIENSEVRSKIVSLLGKESFIQDKLNTSYISSVVFSNSQKLWELNMIVHPAVKNHFNVWLKSQKYPYVVEEAAILYESGHYKDFDYIICVTAPEELRIERVMKRDLVAREQVLKRMAQQMDEREKVKRADFTILNSGKELILPKILELHYKFISFANKKAGNRHG